MEHAGRRAGVDGEADLRVDGEQGGEDGVGGLVGVAADLERDVVVEREQR